MIHLLAVVGLEHDQAGDALFLVLGGIEHIAALLQHTGVDAHEGELAEGVCHHLERQGAEGGVVIGGAHRFCAIGQQTLDRGNIHRGRQVIHHRIQQQLHALVLEGGAAEHRHQAVLQHTVPDALAQLRFRQFAGFQELFDQILIGFGDGLHQLGAPFGGLIGHGGGDVGFFDVLAELILVDEGAVLNQVDDAAQLALSADRQLNRGGVGLEAILDLLVHLQEVGAGAVHLVDEHHARHVVAIRLAPHGFRLGLHATHGAEHGDHTVEHTHGALHLNGEVHVAGGINDVDAVIAPAGGDGRRGDGDAPLALLGHPVRYGGAVVHLTDLVHHTGIEQDPFRGGGFTGINVCRDTDISDAF